MVTITSGVTIQGTVTADTILTPATQSDGGANTIEFASSSIDAEGFAKFTSASIGGFEINDTQISSSGLIMSSSGQIVGDNVLFSGGTITGGVTIQGSVAANSILTPATHREVVDSYRRKRNLQVLMIMGMQYLGLVQLVDFKFITTTLTASKFD